MCVVNYGAITLYCRTFQTVRLTHIKLKASPISLAATFGISVDFFSSGYLDVSVPPVRLAALCIHAAILAYASGFPHSEIPDSSGFYYLIWAYRKLIRPSSPLTAKHPPCTLSHLTIQPEGVRVDVQITKVVSHYLNERETFRFCRTQFRIIT